jgi:hypothetical protein
MTHAIRCLARLPYGKRLDFVIELLVSFLALRYVTSLLATQICGARKDVLSGLLAAQAKRGSRTAVLAVDAEKLLARRADAVGALTLHGSHSTFL